MSTSDLLTRMYAMPSEALKQQQQTLMQKLHTTLGSPTSATTAPSEHCFSASALTFSSCSDPYLQRVFWLLTNSKGSYFAGLCKSAITWADSANAVPEQLRFLTHQRVKAIWLQLRDLSVVQDELLAISPVTFYAHRSTPMLWCALDD
jgi:hypothetical protein